MATFHDSSIEHARRAVAYVLFTEASVCTDENDLLAFLSDVLSEGTSSSVLLLSLAVAVIHRVLRKATGRMMLANRAQMNIFDLLSVLSLLRMDVHNLISFCAARMGRLRGVTKVPPVISPGRNMLRASGDDEDEELVDQAPRPAYLTDIYPPLPRAYTYRRTEVSFTAASIRHQC